MRTLSATLGLDSSSSSITFQTPPALKAENFDLGKPLVPKEESRLPRVPRAELEAAYLNDGTVFNAINASVQLIMSAEHPVIAEDSEVQDYFDEFLSKKLGRTGNPKSWDDLLTLIYRYQFIYGDLLIEKIFNENKSRITDLDIIDPKRHDLARDSSNKVFVDLFGRPVGYTIRIDPFTTSTKVSRVADPPEGVILRTYDLFLPPESIAPFKLFTIGDGLQGLGTIEPIYKTVVRKLNLQHAQANSAFRHSTPIIWAEVGDPNHEPSGQVVDNILKKLRKLRNNYEVSFPYFVKLHMLESKEAEAIKMHLEYLENVQVSGMGVPKAFATASGEATNRATLNVQSDLYELTLQDIAKRTSENIRKFIFTPIAELEGFKEVPRIKWGPIGIDRREKQAQLMLNLVKQGIVSIPEARKNLNQLHFLDADPEKVPPPPVKPTQGRGRPKDPQAIPEGEEPGQ